RRHAIPVQTKPSTVKTNSQVRTARLETTVASENVCVHHAIMFHSSASWQTREMGTSHTSQRKGIEAIRLASFMVLYRRLTLSSCPKRRGRTRRFGRPIP